MNERVLCPRRVWQSLLAALGQQSRQESKRGSGREDGRGADLKLLDAFGL
jgi:hypothetical protein